MAHTCPECGQTCYCGGDIDDIDLGEVIASCTHCAGIDDWDDDDDDRDDPNDSGNP